MEIASLGFAVVQIKLRGGADKMVRITLQGRNREWTVGRTGNGNLVERENYDLSESSGGISGISEICFLLFGGGGGDDIHFRYFRNAPVISEISENSEMQPPEMPPLISDFSETSEFSDVPGFFQTRSPHFLDF